MMTGLSFDFHAAPEGNVSGDAAGSRFRLWEIPSGIGVDRAIDDHVKMAGDALAGAMNSR
jgi:hypothetical protein